MPTINDLRNDIDALVALAFRDLDELWRTLVSPDQAKDLLQGLLPELVQTYGTAASTVAANWYDDLREERAIPGRFTATTAAVVGETAVILARWAIKPLFGPSPDFVSAKTLTEGGLQWRITDGARETIRQSSIEDPKAAGWTRVTEGGCDFCQSLAGGGVVHSDSGVDFQAHDHCRCHAEPVFG